MNRKFTFVLAKKNEKEIVEVVAENSVRAKEIIRIQFPKWKSISFRYGGVSNPIKLA